MLIINRIVDRCHVAETHQDVIRYVISKLAEGFEGYRKATTEAKAILVAATIKRHNDNRELFYRVDRGIF
jgi:hypothetical protein